MITREFCVFIFWLCWVLIAANRIFSSCGKWGLLLVAVCGLRSALASPVVVPEFQSSGSIAVARGLSCSAACGIFPD